MLLQKQIQPASQPASQNQTQTSNTSLVKWCQFKRKKKAAISAFIKEFFKLLNPDVLLLLQIQPYLWVTVSFT